MRSDVPTLSIVTGTINRPIPLQRMITSVLQHTTVPFELIIMDASPEPSGVSNLGNLKIIHESPRMGHVQGYNRAFRMCRGTYVMWLNDDAEVLPGYDVAGINLLNTHGDVGLGAYYYKEGGKFHVNMLYQMIFANFGILPRWLGDRVGWFDTDLTMYGSDNSLTFRVLLAGYGVATVPGPLIIHHSERDTMRIENEHLRRTDADIMNGKYSKYKKEMQQTYRMTQHLVGPRILAI